MKRKRPDSRFPFIAGAADYLGAAVSDGVALFVLALAFLLLLAFFLGSPLAPLLSLAAEAPEDADGEP
jgi:hypothetical protein